MKTGHVLPLTRGACPVSIDHYIAVSLHLRQTGTDVFCRPERRDRSDITVTHVTRQGHSQPNIVVRIRVPACAAPPGRDSCLAGSVNICYDSGYNR